MARMSQQDALKMGCKKSTLNKWISIIVGIELIVGILGYVFGR